MHRNRLCLPSLSKNVLKLFNVVFPPHTWVVSPSVRDITHTQQYICQTVSARHIPNQFMLFECVRKNSGAAFVALLFLVFRSNKPFLNCVHVTFL